MGFSIDIEDVSPATATKYLGGNENNRNLRKTRVDTYARDMKAGKWRLNGDPIRFNGNGKLIDGQHRLMACITANVSFKTAVVRGLTDAAHSTIDTGITRSLGDELKWRGEKDCNNLAAILNLIWTYERGDTGSSPGSRQDLLVILDKNPTVRDSLVAIRTAKAVGFRPTALAAAYFLGARAHSDEEVDAWLKSIADGTDYQDGDPCLALRTSALNAAAVRQFRPTTLEWFAVAIKSYNAFVEGRPVRSLRWRRVGPRRELFPRIIDLEETE